MKKISAVLLMLALSPLAACAEPLPQVEPMDRLERALYGTPREGSLVSRLDASEKDLYGTNLQGTLAERQSAHINFLEKGLDGQPSLLFKMSVAEWGLQLFNGRGRPLAERVPAVEERLEGAAMADRPLANRVDRLLSLVVSDSISAEQTEIPAGTVVRLQLMESLKPSTAKKGNSVSVRLSQNLIVGGKLAAPLGAPAVAEIASVRKPGMFGRPSQIRIAIKSLAGMGSEEIPLAQGKASQEAAEFEASYAAAAGTSILGAIALGPVGLVGGAFIRGNAKTLPAGTVIYAETAQPMTVPAYVIPASLASSAKTAYVDLINGKEVTIRKARKSDAAPEAKAPEVKKETEIDSL